VLLLHRSLEEPLLILKVKSLNVYSYWGTCFQAPLNDYSVSTTA
jgi:hypothetical protein